MIALQEDEVRSRLLQADSSLIQTEESAVNSKRMLAESEEIGREVALNLQRQRGQLENARDGVCDGSFFCVGPACITVS